MAHSDDSKNDIAGSHLPSPIRGIIFDVGSTLFTATTKETRSEMDSAMQRTLVSHFKWTQDETESFWRHYKQIRQAFGARKLFIGTGSVLDEGWLAEPTTKSWVIEACQRMGIADIAADDSVFDDAMAAFGRSRGKNATLIPNVIETIVELKRKYGIRCAICSNDRCAASRLRPQLIQHGLLNDDGVSSPFRCHHDFC